MMVCAACGEFGAADTTTTVDVSLSPVSERAEPLGEQAAASSGDTAAVSENMVRESSECWRARSIGADSAVMAMRFR